MSAYDEIMDKLLESPNAAKNPKDAEHTPADIILSICQIEDGFMHNWEQPASNGLAKVEQQQGKRFPHPQNFKDSLNYMKSFARYVTRHRNELANGTPGEQVASAMDRKTLDGLAASLWMRWHGEPDTDW